MQCDALRHARSLDVLAARAGTWTEQTVDSQDLHSDLFTADKRCFGLFVIIFVIHQRRRAMVKRNVAAYLKSA